jgi:hypothetical protein
LDGCRPFSAAPLARRGSGRSCQIDWSNSRASHAGRVPFDELEIEHIGALPCWVIVQIPAVLEPLGLIVLSESVFWELVLTLCQDAMTQEQCMTISEVLIVTERLTGMSPWTCDVRPGAEGDG